MTTSQLMTVVLILIPLTAYAGWKTNKDAAKLWPITRGWRVFTYGFYAVVGLAGVMIYEKFGLIAGFLVCIPAALLTSLVYCLLCAWYHGSDATKSK